MSITISRTPLLDLCFIIIHYVAKYRKIQYSVLKINVQGNLWTTQDCVLSVTDTQTPILKICLQQNLGGTALDLGLKVSGYHGEFGKKRKKIAPGVQHCVPTANVKNADPGTYIKGNMGKVPKMAVFRKFCPS